MITIGGTRNGGSIGNRCASGCGTVGDLDKRSRGWIATFASVRLGTSTSGTGDGSGSGFFLYTVRESKVNIQKVRMIILFKVKKMFFSGFDQERGSKLTV